MCISIKALPAQNYAQVIPIIFVCISREDGKGVLFPFRPIDFSRVNLYTDNLTKSPVPFRNFLGDREKIPSRPVVWRKQQFRNQIDYEQ